VNDLDCYLANFWRALRFAPDELAAWADWPVNEADLHARHLWLVNQDEFRERMKTDPDFFDVKIAGWWVWGICQWIGSGWCSRPDWTGRTNAGRVGRGIHRKRPVIDPEHDGHGVHRLSLGNSGMGVNRQLPHLGDSGMGVNRQLPHLGNSGMGVNRQLPHLGNSGMGVNRQLPHLGDSGRGGDTATAAFGGLGEGPVVPKKRPMLSGHGSGVGVHSQRSSALLEYFYELSARLRRVRVCSGDWARVLGPSVTIKHGVCGVLLDPPYDMRVVSDPESERDGAAPTDKLYAHHDNDLSSAVRQWALENGDNPLLRIAVCGYEEEHEFPGTWECVAWKAAGGYGSAGNGNGRKNSTRERIWFSKSCLRPQESLFPSNDSASFSIFNGGGM
jgi:hypothetical protein